MHNSWFIFEYVIKEIFTSLSKVKDGFLKCVQVFANFMKQSSDPRVE